jgi:hypothetical protein
MKPDRYVRFCTLPVGKTVADHWILQRDRGHEPCAPAFRGVVEHLHHDQRTGRKGWGCVDVNWRIASDLGDHFGDIGQFRKIGSVEKRMEFPKDQSAGVTVLQKLGFAAKDKSNFSGRGDSLRASPQPGKRGTHI